jgi:Jumping translocation breakpoint protein (JTB)
MVCAISPRVAMIAVMLLFLCFFGPLPVASKKEVCVDAGSCVACDKDELDLDYCRDTGRKMKILCRGQGSKIEDYRACQMTAEDDQIRVLIFQALMAVIGGAAYYGVQTRKQNSMTLFEYRKQRRSTIHA